MENTYRTKKGTDTKDKWYRYISMYQEIARTIDQATASAASSVAECLDSAPLLQLSSPTVSPDASAQLTKATDLKLPFLGSAAQISNQTPSAKQRHPSAVIHPPRLVAQPGSYLSHYDDHCPQSTTRLQGPTRSRVHFYNSHSKDRF
ncbi:unnamed protein product [Clavelina lepadiformis]|uniref:Uncharacterized protein n=1 Tax=Clavelina lepadiformis TaxID=159417 RepID=A0ABP0G9R2_CLALP